MGVWKTYVTFKKINEASLDEIWPWGMMNWQTKCHVTFSFIRSWRWFVQIVESPSHLAEKWIVPWHWPRLELWLVDLYMVVQVDVPERMLQQPGNSQVCPWYKWEKVVQWWVAIAPNAAIVPPQLVWHLGIVWENQVPNCFPQRIHRPHLAIPLRPMRWNKREMVLLGCWFRHRMWQHPWHERQWGGWQRHR